MKESLFFLSTWAGKAAPCLYTALKNCVLALLPRQFLLSCLLRKWATPLSRKALPVTSSCFCLAFAVLCLPAVCEARAAKPPHQLEIVSDYREIPGITEQEIAAIEKIKAERDVLVYGMPPSSESFVMVDTDKPGGFSALFAEDLSRIFGIRFEPANYEWGELIEKLHSGEVSFTNELTSTPERQGTYYFSAPVAQRTLQVMTSTLGETLDKIKQTRRPRYAFFDSAITCGQVQHAEGDTFDSFFVQSSDEVLQLFTAKKIDAFFGESPSMALLDNYGRGIISTYYPLNIQPVSLATADSSLVPFITVLTKYIEAGYAVRLDSLYDQGDLAYLRYKVLSMMTDEEKAYIYDHVHNNTPIPIILENDNYPNAFWNVQEDEYQGIAVEVLATVAKLTGLEFENVNAKGSVWSENLKDLEAGKAALVTDLTRTRSREGCFLWASHPYSTDYFAMVSLKDTPDTNMRRISSARIAILEDAGLVDVYAEWFPGSDNVRLFPNNLATFAALDRGEVDFVMMTRNTLLAMTNYLEKSGYRANLVFDYPVHSQFGFNKNEILLASIVTKAQSMVDVERIASKWTSKTFDYTKTKMLYWLFLSALLAAVFVLLLILFLSQLRMNRRLEKAVQVRTHELSVQTAAAEFASRAKRDFLSHMSHEIRTPLNAIIGMTEIAHRESGVPPKVENAIREIASASTHLRDLINDILDFSKIEAGKFELNKESFQLYPLLDEIYSMMQQRCTDARVVFAVDFSDFTDICAEGDRLRLKQVIINLLGNAIKFTPEGGTIGLQAKIADKTDTTISIGFAITDTGIGMTEEQLSRLFTAFEQADKSISTKYGGTGLGLAISQNIVQQMGSKIIVESQVGQGSSFRFSLALPLADKATVTELYDVTVPNLEKHRILLAEDIAVNRFVLRELLSITSVTIDDAVDGQEAVDIFAQSPVGYYSLIFMDVQMPRKNGYEAASEIRSLGRPDAGTIPIVAMTANAYRDDVENAIDAGMNAHIAKPIDINIVLATLAEILCKE